MTTDTPAIDKFHKHLDECKQCRENPFALCFVGTLLLDAAAAEALNIVIDISEKGMK
jgi:hypothetical protein